MIEARSLKVTTAIPNDAFPISIIPEKGAPGSASAKIAVEILIPEAGKFRALLSGRTLQRARDTAQASPGGFWVISGRLGAGGEIKDAGVAYQAPAQPKEAQAA